MLAAVSRTILNSDILRNLLSAVGGPFGLVLLLCTMIPPFIGAFLFEKNAINSISAFFWLSGVPFLRGIQVLQKRPDRWADSLLLNFIFTLIYIIAAAILATWAEQYIDPGGEVT